MRRHWRQVNGNPEIRQGCGDPLPRRPAGDLGVGSRPGRLDLHVRIRYPRELGSGRIPMSVRVLRLGSRVRRAHPPAAAKAYYLLVLHARVRGLWTRTYPATRSLYNKKLLYKDRRVRL